MNEKRPYPSPTGKISDLVKGKNSGQVLVEYILLMAIVLILSFSVLKIANTGLADIWLYIARKIAYPSSVVDFRQ